MKVTGITIIRNAIINDYPIVEAIRSVLPLVDEMIVAVGDSQDATESLIRSIGDDKVRIVHSTWDLSMRKGGVILAAETNKVLQHVSADTDWIFYIQGDEVIHEQYRDTITDGMKKYMNDTDVEGLLFRYVHFYGTYDYIGDSRKWYNCETRIIRNIRGIYSYRDAQGFRKLGDQKINVAKLDAAVFHYGWVKHPRDMKIKQKQVAPFWDDNDASVNNLLAEEDFFDYNQFDALAKFKGTHPEVMKERINSKNWHVELDIRKKKMKFKYKILHAIEKLTGKRLFTFSNHHIIRS
jgi:hypothetical protein